MKINILRKKEAYIRQVKSSRHCFAEGEGEPSMHSSKCWLLSWDPPGQEAARKAASTETDSELTMSGGGISSTRVLVGCVADVIVATL